MRRPRPPVARPAHAAGRPARPSLTVKKDIPVTMTLPARRRATASLACGLFALASFAPLALAQSAPAAAPYEPMRGQAGKDVIWIPTPDGAVDRMLQMAEVKPNDRVVDLGSGDGKIAIAAARNHGATARGLEYNPKMVDLSVRMAQQAGVSDKVKFQEADIFVTDFSEATVVTMYLLPQLNLRLRPQLFRMKPGTRVVSHSFRMGNWWPDEVSRVGSAELFLWRIPANAGGTWRMTGASGLPHHVQFTQRFQQLEGQAAYDNQLTAGVVQPRLSGESISFGVRDAGGAMMQFQGRVAGNRITGTMSRATGGTVPFEAVREGPAEPIQGIEAGEQEGLAAARALEAGPN